MLTLRRSSGISLLVGSLGVILVVLGLGILSIDVFKAHDSGGWHSDSVLDFLTSPWMDHFILGDLADWLRSPRTFAFLSRPVAVMLDLIPDWLGLLAVGALVIWKAMK